MFRRKEDTLAPDASYPANLEELGFFINRLGHVRMIEAPEKPFVFNSTNIERHNEVRNEAFHACSRAGVIERLSKLGIKQLYFPTLTTTKPDGPHVPILAPPAEVLKTRKRIIVIVNDSLQDLGILAYRLLQRDLGLNGGSVVNFAKEMTERSTNPAHTSSIVAARDIFKNDTEVEHDTAIPGLVVMNTGQLLYSHKYNRSMTTRSWYALPRKSIAHDHIRIHEGENYLEGHRSPAQHVKTVFDDLLCNTDRVSPEVEVYIVAIEGGASYVMDVFKENFDKYCGRITAMAMIQTLVEDSEIANPNLKAFLHQRTRQWRYSDLSINPTQCTELPDDYSPAAAKVSLLKDVKTVRWNEELSSHNAASRVTKVLHNLAIDRPSNGTNPTPSKSVSDTSSDWGDASVPCPTFAGGKESTGECIFTEPAVQRAILSFFEEVAQDPENYRNPAFTTMADIPRPTADAPFALDANATMPQNANVQAASQMLTPEQAELEDARAKLADMRIALDACPENDDTLAKGRVRLEEKIAKQKTVIEELQVKALSSGSLGAGEAEEVRQDWSPKLDGPKVSFAGAMVDSELLKAAGLGETADEKELEKIDGEKAFI